LLKWFRADWLVRECILRSDRDTRGFVIPKDDLDEALTGGIGAVLLFDQTATVGFARLSQSGLAMNIVIDTQLHTVPLRSLIPVLERESPRKSAAVCACGRCGAGCRGVRTWQIIFCHCGVNKLDEDSLRETSETMWSWQTTSAGSEMPL